MTSGQDPAIKSIALTTVQTNFVPFDNKNKIMENAPHASMVANEEFGISSPNMKRQKLENQGASCKRCNCKRSKCLKLYCECFAAGLYCIEPCSCLDCFNNPGHEGTVLETWGQIESRNPLAFAPKVIRNLDSASEFRETNKTPASARHKRGCNCKKSSCLKKYCECFQGGVGCSSYCRCEGCKNTFGCKSGVEEDDLKWEESKIHEDASDLNLLDIIERVKITQILCHLLKIPGLQFICKSPLVRSSKDLPFEMLVHQHKYAPSKSLEHIFSITNLNMRSILR